LSLPSHFNLRPFLCFAGHPDLPDFEDDVRFPVVRYKPGVAEAINEVFRAKVVWVAEFTPEADNADANAAWVACFSRRRCHGFSANSQFKLGTG